jgi:hypothetical protein
VLPFLLFGLLAVFPSSITASDHAALWGTVHSSGGTALEGVRLRLQPGTDPRSILFESSGDGTFQITGLAPGRYTLVIEHKGYWSYSCDDLFLDPGAALHLRVSLSPSQSEQPSTSRRVSVDHTWNTHQTVLDRSLIQGLPAAHNPWALVENLDLSATSNRIDVGGLYSGIPALFSARGGTSWTQSAFQLNGMDITDPYRGGRPLLYPDFYSLDYTQLINGGFPSSAVSPGGIFNMITPEGGDRFHGGVSAFYLNHSLQASNITPQLEVEGLTESNGFHFMLDGNARVSGPLIPRKLHFYSSLAAFDLSRDIAEFEEHDRSRLLSGTLGLSYLAGSGRIRFLWTGQKLGHDSFGARRGVPFSTTNSRSELFNAAQLIWETRLRSNHFVRMGFGFAQADIRSEFQDDIPGPHGTDIFLRTPIGSAPLASEDNRRTLTFDLKGDLWLSSLLGARHRLQYGLFWQEASAGSQKEIWEDTHLRFHEGNAQEVVFFNTPLKHSEAGRRWDIFIQDSLVFPGLFSVYAGLSLSGSRGWVPGRGDSFSTPVPFQGSSPETSGKISWLNLAPRLGVSIPLTRARTTALKLAYARYYYSLPLSYLTHGHPDALSGLAYTWDDANGDGAYQDGEAGGLLRREGPYFGSIDPAIKRPRTDEISISYNVSFGKSWSFVLAGFTRNTRYLIHNPNVGVPFDAYTPEYHIDAGDDRVPNTYDDLVFTVFNQDPETLGQDAYRLMNVEPDTRNTVYFGADLNLIKRFGERFTFFLSLTAIQADGHTNPGNTEYENDDGVVGDLFFNPNNLINAGGRVRFDRAYTARLGIDYLAPYDIRLGLVIKYYDGQPFARKIIIEGFNQGPFYIQANPRGASRYEYNNTMDVRIEKILRLGAASRLRIILDGFNVMNRSLATEENEWTGPEYPLRYATEIQSPRVFRLGLAYEF